MVLKAELQKTLSAGECRQSGAVSHSDGVRGTRGSPQGPQLCPAAPRDRAGVCAVAGRGPPIAGPFLAGLPGGRPLSAASHPPSQTPATFPGLASPLSSTQKLQARRLLSTAPIFPPRARARGPHRRPAVRGRAGKEPGRPP